MTCQEDITLHANLLEWVNKQGFDILLELIQMMHKQYTCCIIPSGRMPSQINNL